MRKEVTYYTPSLKAPRIFCDVLEEHNTLIAGAVGSGKTTFENGLIYSILNECDPGDTQFYLIDPKQFELRHFRNVPHCMGYADTPEDALKVLDTVERLREARSNWMKNHGLRKWQGSVVYVFIDELADLMTGDRKYAKEFCEKLVKIMQLGRALNIRVVALTQQPRREVTPARLQVNFTCNVALHCRSAIESRQIIGIPGAEDLPRYGECYVSSAGYVEKKSVPYITDETMGAMIDYWTSEKCLTGDTSMIESSYTTVIEDEEEEEMSVTKTWKVYGADGHRQREAFGESYVWDFSTEKDGIRIIEVLNHDKTGTYDYSIIKITRPTEALCEAEFNGQLSDGVFENSRVGRIVEVE